MGTHLRVLNESFLMNTNVQDFDDFQICLSLRTLHESSLSIEGVKLVIILHSKHKLPGLLADFLKETVELRMIQMCPFCSLKSFRTDICKTK